MRGLLVVSALVLVFTAGSCGDESSTGERQMSAAGLPGCHTVCPPCVHAKPPCMAKCAIICNPQKCGSSVCAIGEFCCNSSCGICAPAGGACIDIMCTPTKQPRCTTETDCVMYQSFCGNQATCGVYLNGEKSPKICPPAPNVRYADPCLGLVAVCDSATGTCILQ